MIVDDELIAIKMMEKLIGNYEQLKIIKSISDPEIVLNEIETLKPDLLFLDINMGSLSGIELGNYLSEMFPEMKIVFVTAYSEYAVEAFELNAIDYLLKPVSKKRFDKMMDRLLISREVTNFINFNVFQDAQISNDNGKILRVRTRKATELLFLLWIHEKEGLSKDDIMEALWPNQPLDTSTMMLHTTIYQVRQKFKKEYKHNPIKYRGGKYFLDLKVTSDLDDVLILLEEKISEESFQKLLKIYRGKMFEKNDYLWSYNQAELLHHQIIEYLIQAIELNVVKLSDYHKIMMLFEEDILSTEQYVDLIYAYLKNMSEDKQAKLFKKRAAHYLEKELDVYI